MKLVELELPKGRVIDFGCGYGFDADHYDWESYDPCYRPNVPEGLFDTVICISVINALSKKLEPNSAYKDRTKDFMSLRDKRRIR